jgi:CoA:oxalate CoA-transferase
MPGPIEGKVVLDLTHVLAGPFAGMVLSDLGATVIKVEKPEIGDRARGTGPFIDDESSYFMSVNRGKLGLGINLAEPDGKELFLKLIDKADVVLENFVPGTMKRLGLDYENLKIRNPGLIYAAISGFGQDGPYSSKAALDIIVQGMGGMLSITGQPDGPPVRPGNSQGDITAGLFAVIGILAALQEKGRSGIGQMVDIGMLDCQVAILENAFTRYLVTGDIPKPLGTRHPSTAPFQAFETKDGYITVAMAGGKDKWPLFCVALGHIDLIDDPRFLDGWSRSQSYEELEPILSSAMKQKTSQEWLNEFEEVGIICGPVNTIDKVVEDQQVKHRGMIRDIYHPRLGTIKGIGTPLKFSRTSANADGYAPSLGEHTIKVLRDIAGVTEEEIYRLEKNGTVSFLASAYLDSNN